MQSGFLEDFFLYSDFWNVTGDGVNDVMALKEADCSIAMQSGSDAARNVSQLVLISSSVTSVEASTYFSGKRTPDLLAIFETVS